MEQDMDTSPSTIDDSLYSRQRYVLGDQAMHRMAISNVFLYGLGGLGVEIAKNVVLAGVKRVTLCDPQPCSLMDLGCQFYITEDDVRQQKSRAEACCKRLADLNPYVTVDVHAQAFTSSSDITFLSNYQCVVLTECPLDLQIRVNDFCRTQQPQKQMITGDVYGLFAWTFVDFGDEFEVVDRDGEEPKEFFVSFITKANPGVVTTLDNRMHGLESGDVVTFREVRGMTALNGPTYQVQAINAFQFSICDTTDKRFSTYECGGICRQIKQPKLQKFESLRTQLKKPRFETADLCKFESPLNIHLGMLAINKFQAENGRLPGVRCANDAAEVVRMASTLNAELDAPLTSVNEALVTSLSMTCRGQFAPLCACLGGVMAQEVLKALTAKFTPLSQWLYLDVLEISQSDVNIPKESFLPRQDRYDSLRICVGDSTLQQLAQLSLFMVGCGAIGCEMLKNLALLGVSTAESGLLTITDDDVIEKSNLNRQFLFRANHIRQPKSTVAAESARHINTDLHITALQHRVCPQTEATVFPDGFLRRQNVVVNALDNVAARRYVDSRCVSNQRPLLESGTMGTKGHVQVIIPHLTESYSSQRDPVDEDVPFCTLKSFPAQIEHCIQWARDKFESSFTQKPAMFAKFWSGHGSVADIIETLAGGTHLDGCVQVGKLSASKPKNSDQCIALARGKFEKYFNHKAKHLLHAFPLDTKLANGSLFWTPPKRAPVPLEFSSSDSAHMAFIKSCARLYADIHNIAHSIADWSDEHVQQVLCDVTVPAFRPTTKRIETDESAKRQEQPAPEVTPDDAQQAAARIRDAVASSPLTETFCSSVRPLSFEKDDDTNDHICFISAASNLRARMYGIEEADRLKTKRIAGRIIPAIATTTAAVAGLVSIELVKACCGLTTISCYKNAFLNLALPLMVLSEPGPVSKTQMSNGLSYSIWDLWEVRGSDDMTLQQFLNTLKSSYRVDASMVVQGSKMVYVPIMPGHKKRLNQTMLKLLKGSADREYVDLVVSYAGGAGDEDELGPPVRYYFKP